MDDLDLVKQILEFIIEELGDKFSHEIEQLTNINLHHRHIEYMLYSRQIRSSGIRAPNEQSNFQ